MADLGTMGTCQMQILLVAPASIQVMDSGSLAIAQMEEQLFLCIV